MQNKRLQTDRAKSSMNESFARELDRFDADRNSADWKRIRTGLDRLGSAIYRKRPDLWLGTYGIGNPSYVFLLFFDVTNTGYISSLYGFRRALALIAQHAESEGNQREVGRAVLLLSHYKELRRSYKNRDSARKPRRSRRNTPTDEAIKKAALEFLNTKGHTKKMLAGALERSFITSGTPITAKTIRSRLKKMGI